MISPALPASNARGILSKLLRLALVLPMLALLSASWIEGYPPTDAVTDRLTTYQAGRWPVIKGKGGC